MTTVKTCFKCGETKAISEFYKHPCMGDGHLGKCKECTKTYVRAHRASNQDYYREYERLRGKTEKRKAHMLKNLRAQRARFPEKNLARQAVNKAVASGQIQRLPCWVCGGKAEAHHPDYSMPLDVVWLCQKHHREAHKIAKEAA